MKKRVKFAAEVLLLAAVNFTYDGEIHQVVEKGDVKRVAELLSFSPDLVRAVTSDGRTPLYIAAGKGDEKMAQLLLTNKADPNVRFKDGDTALHAAALRGHTPVVQLLLANRAQVDAKNVHGQTALHLAVQAGQTAVAEALIASNADVNIRSTNGQTPLHLAAERGSAALVKVLLDHRADLAAKDNHGQTPLSLATNLPNKEVAELLAQRAAPKEAVPDSSVVGELGDFQRLIFDGAKTFTAEAIRDGLAANPDFLIAAHPLAPMADYLKTVQRKVVDGYLDGGFPDVAVTTRLDEKAGHILVKVVEGPRYFTGDIKVSGARTIPLKPFLRRFTEPYTPNASPFLKAEQGNGEPATPLFSYLDSNGKQVKPESPLWDKEDPAPFDAATLESLSAQLTNILSEFGYFFPKASLRIVPRAGGTNADLLIDIADEGPHGVIDSIEVYGNKNNTRQEVLEFLKLKPGLPIEHDLVAKTEIQLWNSGRFTAYKITPERDAADRAKIKLVMELTECPEAPSLGKAFSREESVLLKLRDWLLTAPVHGEDMVMTANGDGILLPSVSGLEIIVSSKGMTVRTLQSPTAAPDQPRYAFIEATNSVAMHGLARRKKLVLAGNRWQFKVSVAAVPQTDPEAGGRSNLSISGGFGSSNSDDPAKAVPFQMDLLLAPVVFVTMAHDTNSTNRIQNNMLLLRNPGSELKIDVASGRLIEMNSSNAEDKVQGHIFFQKGAFDRAVKEIEAASAKDPNALREGQLVSSFAGFVIDDILQGKHLAAFSSIAPETLERATRVADKVLAEILAPVDKLLTDNPRDKNSRFTVPPDAPLGVGAPMNAWVAMFAAWIFKFTNDLFPARSWPWTLAREAVFVATGHDRYTSSELQRLLDSDQTGPLGYLTAASLLSYAKSPAAQSFAAKGLQSLSLDDFHKDCRLALEGKSGLRECSEKLAHSLRGLSVDDVEAVAALFPSENAAFVRAWLNATRTGPLKPAREVLAPLLDLLWEKYGRQQTKAALSRVASHAEEIAQQEPPFQEAMKLFQGEGVAQDDEQAAKLFRKAAELGHPGGQYFLGLCFEKGRGVAKDMTEALKWYRRAGENGVSEACLALGNLYSEGFSVPQDQAEAFIWYSLAATKGDPIAEAFRNGARRKLSAEQLAQATKRLATMQARKSGGSSKK